MVDVKKVPIEDIKPNDYNPNVMSDAKFEALIYNIEKEGEMLQPILLNKDLVIIDGEHRWRASKQAGLTEIWAIVVETSEEEAKVKTIGFNNIQGQFDPLKLNELLNQLVEAINPDELSKQIAMNMNRIEKMSADIEEDLQVEEDFEEMFDTEGELDDFEIERVKREVVCPNCGHKFEE